MYSAASSGEIPRTAQKEKVPLVISPLDAAMVICVLISEYIIPVFYFLISMYMIAYTCNVICDLLPGTWSPDEAIKFPKHVKTEISSYISSPVLLH